MHIVLVEPEIPQNTGNIGRLCAATETPLHLVGKLGFSLSDKYLKRAGLDYWPYIHVIRHNSYQDFFSKCKDDSRLLMFTARGGAPYNQINFQWDDYLLFGSETKGLPESLLKEAGDNKINIPTSSKVRSLNLANAVSIVLYHGLQQLTGDNWPWTP